MKRERERERERQRKMKSHQYDTHIPDLGKGIELKWVRKANEKLGILLGEQKGN